MVWGHLRRTCLEYFYKQVVCMTSMNSFQNELCSFLKLVVKSMLFLDSPYYQSERASQAPQPRRMRGNKEEFVLPRTVRSRTGAEWAGHIAEQSRNKGDVHSCDRTFHSERQLNLLESYQDMFGIFVVSSKGIEELNLERIDALRSDETDAADENMPHKKHGR